MKDYATYLSLYYMKKSHFIIPKKKKKKKKYLYFRMSSYLWITLYIKNII